MAGTGLDFGAFVDSALPSLRRLALVLTQDDHDADDLVQATLEKLYMKWDKLSINDTRAYSRAVMVKTLRSSRRRGWWRFERPHSVVACAPSNGDLDGAVDRIAMLVALRELPVRQREVVVLRYLEDLSVKQVAQLLSCSTGTVKRAAHDGLNRLRGNFDQAHTQRG